MNERIPHQIAVPDSAFIADTATLVGTVTLGDECSVWFSTVLRGDIEPITVGKRTNIQDGSVVHVDNGCPVRIGQDVTIGHRCVIHACDIGDGCLIGMGAVILSGARIGERCIIGAGAVVPEGADIPPGSLVLGVPGKVKRTLTDAEFVRMERNSADYVALSQSYLQGYTPRHGRRYL
jgi:carbonic anhydrase/acetyltransferase-like protein (isoleucine patch superfamily)